MEISYTIPTDFGWRLAVTLLVLAAFGVWYNRQVEQAERDGTLEGLTWLAVAFGSAVTILLPGIVFHADVLPGWLWTLIVLASFAASGAAMIAGALQRFNAARRAERERIANGE